VGALADAYVAPEQEAENPLRVTEGWKERPEFTALRGRLDQELAAELPVQADEDPSNLTQELTVLSDHWMEQDILEVAREGDLDGALQRSQLWSQLRPGRFGPAATRVRILHMRQEIDARDEAVAKMLAMETDDLNELEEARVALGELELWRPQIEVLDR